MKDNPHGYWFKRRRYGWGWMPVTWQGWLAIAASMVIVALDVLLLALTTVAGNQPSWQITVVFFVILILDMAVLLGTCHLHAPPAKWRWGKSDSDNPHEDF